MGAAGNAGRQCVAGWQSNRRARAAEVRFRLDARRAGLDRRDARRIPCAGRRSGHLPQHRGAAWPDRRQMDHRHRYEAYGAVGGPSCSVFHGSHRQGAQSSAAGRGAGFQRHAAGWRSGAHGGLGGRCAAAHAAGRSGAADFQRVRFHHSVSFPSERQTRGREIRHRLLLREERLPSARSLRSSCRPRIPCSPDSTSRPARRIS